MANFKKKSGEVRVPASELKDKFLEAVADGVTIEDALVGVGRSRSWYEQMRRADSTFRGRADMARQLKHMRSPSDRRALAGSFAEFREKYLGTRTFPHQQCWVDLLEGADEPSWLHPSFTFEPARKTRLLVNTPPNHAKSTTVTADYATYRVCRDPNVRIIIVSQTQAMAKKFLYSIKSRLTHPKYLDLQMAFAPEGGFRATADSWTAQCIYLGDEVRDSGEKDPTVEALGLNGHIYGARADLIICDDIVTLKNASDWGKQQDLLRQEFASRLGPLGQLLVIGTRVASQDLYRELRNKEHYTDNKSPWTYFAQPAVLESADDPKDWVTLWPKSDVPFEGAEDVDMADDDGLFDRWTGPRLSEVRNDIGPSKWAMVYQQQDVSSEAVFDPVCVRGSVNGMRKRGPLLAGATGHPKDSDGFYRICSMDPATKGDTAAVSYAVDRVSKKRYVTDVSILHGPTPSQIRELIYMWTELHRPNEWVIEANAFQSFLTQDEEIRLYLANRGIVMRSHYTGKHNKKDPDFGVASMEPLFGTKEVRGENQGFTHAGNNLVDLPDVRNNEAVKTLIEQLVVWDPTVSPRDRKCDAVMALWFAELRAREVLLTAAVGESFYTRNPFTSQRDVDRRMVVSLDELAAGTPTMNYR